jgi:hypothetical protein
MQHLWVRSAYSIWVTKLEGKETETEMKKRDRKEGLDVDERTINSNLREMGWGAYWIHLARDRDQFRSLVNKVMHFRRQ